MTSRCSKDLLLARHKFMVMNFAIGTQQGNLQKKKKMPVAPKINILPDLYRRNLCYIPSHPIYIIFPYVRPINTCHT